MYLDACIIYNGDAVREKDRIIDYVRGFISQLQQEYVDSKNLLAFNTELIRQKLIQDAMTSSSSHRSNYISWLVYKST